MIKIKVFYTLYGNKNKIVFKGDSQYFNWQETMRESFSNNFNVLGIENKRGLWEKIEWRLRVWRNDIGLKLGKRSTL